MPKFIAVIIGKFIKNKIKLEDSPMETKKWFQSKNVWTGVVTALMGLYLSLAPQFGWPSVPEWVFSLLGAIGIYTRITADTKIS